MKTAIKYVSAALLLLCSVACGSDNDETEDTTPIVGKWEVYQWRNSSGTFTDMADGSYFAFYASGSYVYYNGALLNDYVTGEYSYNSAAGTIHCSEAKGYSMTINVTQSGDSATFAWHYDVTPESVTTVKVKRK